jgi:hypothetical protein
MAANPVIQMAAASVACCALVFLFSGSGSVAPILFGMFAPLGVAIGSWTIVERVHTQTPAQVSGVMIKLFAAKLLVFGAYVAAVVLLLPSHRVLFVLSFTFQYILLHMIEAVHLRRLFVADGNPPRRLSVS